MSNTPLCLDFTPHEEHDFEKKSAFDPSRTMTCPGFYPKTKECSSNYTHKTHLYSNAGELSDYFLCPGRILTVAELNKRLGQFQDNAVVTLDSCCCGEALEVDGQIVVGDPKND